MNSAIALLHCSASLLIQKQFGGVPIATGVLLVAIPEKSVANVDLWTCHYQGESA